MTQRSKRIALFLILSLLVLLFAACDGGEKPKVTEAPSAQSSQSESESATETAEKTESEEATEAVSDTETETELGTEAVSETETETESDTEAVSDTETETELGTEAVSETETETESDTEAVSDTNTETDTEAVSDTETETETEFGTEKDTEQGGGEEKAEPSYLGILASSDAPSEQDGVPVSIAPRARVASASYRMYGRMQWRSFDEALKDFISDEAELPVASDYSVYATAGETVYIQIWLDNPEQYTVLSLKLNGTKYQIGGGLSSFFIREGDMHYNCLYVAVTIPQNAHTEQSYEVSDIEYISNTFISEDGTDAFMNGKDTVKIGLPYGAQMPTVSDFSQSSLTFNGYGATFTLTDAENLAKASGAWLGVAVYDGYGVLYNQRIDSGSHILNVTGLVEGSDYDVIVYLYGDLHDGRGVFAHVLQGRHFLTSEAITRGEIIGTLLYNAQKDGYYGAIKVNTTLNSQTAEYIKLEILDREGSVVYTDTHYNGAATVSEGILCGTDYTVRVYYKDTEYPEGKYIEENVWVEYLGTPWYQEAGGYGFVNDAVYYFQLSNGDRNYPVIDRFVLKLYNEESARWVASDVLYLLDNPTAIDDLNAQIDALRDEFNAAYGNDDLMWSIHQQMSALEEQRRPLDYALWYLESRADNNRDRAYWQAEAEKGKYFYEFEYSGTNTEKLFKVGKTYYVVLDDALISGVDGFDMQIDYKYDKQDGGDFAEGVVKESFRIKMLNYYNGTEVRNVELNGNKLTFSLVNVDDYSISDLGGETTYEKGYVYKIIARNDAWEEVVLYEIVSVPTPDVDEAAWLAEYIRRIKAGESVDGLYDMYVPKYEESYSITLDLTGFSAGRKDITIYTRKMSESYEDGEYDREFFVQIGIYAQLPTPSIEFTEYEGRIVHDWHNNWFGEYACEAKDQNGNPMTLSTDGGSSFHLPAPGTQIRVKLLADGYWLESEWSEWYTFEGIKVIAPELGEYVTTRCTISWSLGNSENISHFVYTINGGTPVRIELDGNRSVFLNNGDVFRVKCVPTTDAIANGYVDSAWVTYTCVDSRTALAIPTNVRYDDDAKCLIWDAVDGVSRYVVEEIYNGVKREYEWGKTTYSGVKPGATYRVRALPKNSETQRSSDFSEGVTVTGK